MEVFSLETNVEGAAGIHCDFPTYLHGVQEGFVREPHEADGGYHPLV